MKIGITGSQRYTKKMKIKDLLWMIKNKDEDAEIISLGEEYGVDKFIRKYCIEFEIKYAEFIPRHKKWNNNCIEKAFLFNRPYSARNFFINFVNYVKYCDDFVYFYEHSDELKDNKLIEMIKKSGKNLILVE